MTLQVGLANDPWLLLSHGLGFSCSFSAPISIPPTPIPLGQVRFPLHFAHTFLSCLPTATKERVQLFDLLIFENSAKGKNKNKKLSLEIDALKKNKKPR